MTSSRRLLLLRHAEAGPYRDTLEGDKARALTPHGRNQAHSVGHALARRDAAGAMSIISSAATRTRETAEIVRDCIGPHAVVTLDESLYAADVAAFYDLINSLPDETITALIVGHNPAIGALAQDLAGPSTRDPAFSALHSGYPTATLAIFAAPEQWVDFRPSTVTLEALILP